MISSSCLPACLIALPHCPALELTREPDHALDAHEAVQRRAAAAAALLLLIALEEQAVQATRVEGPARTGSSSQQELG